jgi:hypothetical protein
MCVLLVSFLHCWLAESKTAELSLLYFGGGGGVQSYKGINAIAVHQPAMSKKSERVQSLVQQRVLLQV